MTFLRVYPEMLRLKKLKSAGIVLHKKSLKGLRISQDIPSVKCFRIIKDFQLKYGPYKTHLCVGDDHDPVGLLWPRHRQHGPEEDGHRVEEGQQTGVDEVVQYQDKVADEFRVRHQRVEQ